MAHYFPVISDKANQVHSRKYYLVSVLGKDNEKTKNLWSTGRFPGVVLVCTADAVAVG